MKLNELFEGVKEGNLIGFEKDGQVSDPSKEWIGDFYCSYNSLTSLEGAPSSVGGNFYCSDNKLTSLEGAPSSVSGNFNCNNNKLTSLKGAPSSVGGDFDCYNNNLTSLEFAPTLIHGSFNCIDNKLLSLQNIHKQIKEINGIFFCSTQPNRIACSWLTKD